MLFNPKSEFSIRYNSYDEMREYNVLLSFYFLGEQRAALLMEKKEANCAQVDVV